MTNCVHTLLDNNPTEWIRASLVSTVPLLFVGLLLCAFPLDNGERSLLVLFLNCSLYFRHIWARLFMSTEFMLLGERSL